MVTNYLYTTANVCVTCFSLKKLIAFTFSSNKLFILVITLDYSWIFSFYFYLVLLCRIGYSFILLKLNFIIFITYKVLIIIIKTNYIANYIHLYKKIIINTIKIIIL